MARSSAPTDSASELASEIFVLGFPLLVMDAIRRAHPLAPTGFQRFPPGAQQIVPGLFWDEDDCCETSAAFDLTPTPAVLDLPDPEGRFLSVTLFDAAGAPFASVGPQGADATRRITLTAPSWRGDAASEAQALQAPSEWIWAVSRIVGRSATERPQLETLASRQRFSPLAAPGAPKAAPQLGALDLVSVRHLARQTPQHLFHRLWQLIERAPPAAQDEVGPALKARLGEVAPQGAPALAPDISQACVRGFVDGWSRVLDAYEELLSGGGADWEPVGQTPGGATSAAQQAALAFAQIGAPRPHDILCLRCGADATGRMLTGAAQYRLVFEPGPPALWGWRLGAGERRDLRKGGFIGNHSPLVRDGDGRIEVVVGSEPPDDRPTANWLRAPRGRFELTLRLYRPAPEALEGRWRMQRIECVGAKVDGPPARRRAGPSRPGDSP